MLKISKIVKDKSAMMLSLPNSGTDWLMQCIRRDDSVIYFREYFNPVTNGSVNHILDKGFGCETEHTYRNIAADIDELTLQRILNDTWMQSEFNFTKENYSMFRVNFFAPRFNCFALYRPTRLSIPSLGSPDSVNRWYHAIYHSIMFNMNSLPESIRVLATWVQENAVADAQKYISSHVMASYQLLQAAKENNVPIMKFEDLMTADAPQIEQMFAETNTVLEPAAIARAIVNTRRRRHSEFHRLDLDFYNKLVEQLPDWMKEYL